MFYFYLQRSKISTKFQYFYFSACSVSSICSLATADTGVKFDNLCIKRQTLRQSTEQRRPTADYGPPGRKRPLPRGRSWRHCWYSLNTSLPASAACERLFSCEGLTMNSHRTCMSEAVWAVKCYSRWTSLCTVCNDFYTFTNTDYLHSLPMMVTLLLTL